MKTSSTFLNKNSYAAAMRKAFTLFQSLKALAVFFILFISVNANVFGQACTPTITGTNPYYALFSGAGSCTWTVPAGVSSITVYVYAGGGGSGGATSASNDNASGGGGGGACAIQTWTGLSGNTLTITKGAGGAGGSTAGTAGSAGGASTVACSGFTSVVANGGGGGGGCTTNGSAGTAGAGATTGAGYTTLYTGGNGTVGYRNTSDETGGAGGGGAGNAGNGGNGSGSISGTTGGAGGTGTPTNAAPYKGGAGASATETTGTNAAVAGNVPGGGAAGCADYNAATAGAAGGAGQVIIYYTVVACTAPTTQATMLPYSAVTSTTNVTVNWTRGNGTNVLVVGRLTSATLSAPASGTAYTANTVFGSGTQIGTGNYVVYNGTGTNVAVTGLTADVQYTFTAYEYNTTGTCYLTPGSSSNFTYIEAFSSPSFGSTTWCAGETRSISIVVTNSGTMPWTSGSGNNVNFSSWWNTETQDVNCCGHQAAFTTTLTPGNSHTITWNETARSTPGTYTLNIDCVHEVECWFRNNSGSCGPGNPTYVSPSQTVVSNPISSITPAGPTLACGGTTVLTLGLPTGGTITTVGGNRIHTFTASGTFTTPAGLSASVLAVGGGGAGGENGGGGGGAGGYVYNIGFNIAAGSFPVVIGAGGIAIASSMVPGPNGSNTTFSTITANGGGGGGSRDGGPVTNPTSPWSVPSGMTSIPVLVWGGGGGGADAYGGDDATDNSSGGGGGGGAFATKTFTVSGATFTITSSPATGTGYLSSGGKAATTSGASGGNGGTITVTYTGTGGGSCIAVGGTGGTGENDCNNDLDGAGGAGGLYTSCTPNTSPPSYSGGAGATGDGYIGESGAGGGGAGNGGAGGAASVYTAGGGGAGGTPSYPGGAGAAGEDNDGYSEYPGYAGTAPGGGGSGGEDGDCLNAVGGAGGAGQVIFNLPNCPGQNGGSGGGGGGGVSSANCVAGTGSQGNSGGTGYTAGCPAAGAGGGGAGNVGTAGASNQGGNGGAGLSNSISGTATFYCGGGAGGPTCPADPGYFGTAGNGGGGTGGASGVANTGGGGSGNGGNGGSGVLIISYPDPTTGTWTSSNTSMATVSPTTGASTTVTAGTTPGTTTITYTIACGGSVSQQSTTVTVKGPTTSTITTTPLSYCGTLTSGALGGNTPSTGTGAWSVFSGGSGTFSAPTSGSSTFTANAAGTSVLQWTTSYGTCSSSSQVTVNLYSLPTIILGSFPTVCSGTTSALLPFTAVTNGANYYSITWDPTAIGQGFANVGMTLLPLPAPGNIPIVVPGGAAGGTYNGTITVENWTTACVSGTPVPFTVTINSCAVPAITSFYPMYGCAGSTTVTVTGTNLAGITSITVNGTAATTIIPISSTQVAFNVPAGATTGYIVVTNTSGSGSSNPQVFTVINDATAPTHDMATVDQSCWILDGAHSYNITLYSTEAPVPTGSGIGGVSGFYYGISMLINYLNPDGSTCGACANNGGFFSWNPVQANLTSQGFTQNPVTTTGTAGGYAGVYAAGYGNTKITLNSCTANNSSGHYTITFNVTPNATFPALATDEVSMFAVDNCDNYLPWDNQASFSSGLSVGGSISGYNSSICSGGSTGTMTLGGGYLGSVTGWESSPDNITWTPIPSTSGSTTYSTTISSVGTYYYHAIVQNGNCSSAISSPATITVNPAASVSAGAALPAICQGGTTGALGGSFGGSATAAVWSDGGAGGSFINNGGTTPNTATYTPSAPSTVTLTLTANGCGTPTASKTLTVNPLPTGVSAGSALTAICQGQTTAALGGSLGTGTSGVWSDGGASGTFANNTGTTPNTATYTASATATSPITLTLTVSTAAGCTATASKPLTINTAAALPSPVTATPAYLCLGASSSLSATTTGSNQIEWFTSSTGGSPLASTTSGANYTVTPTTGTTTYYAEGEIVVTAAGAILYPYSSSNQTFTVPAGVGFVTADAWGGGGGGGGVISGNCSGGSGGGGGAFSIVTFAVTPGQTFTIAGGAGGSAGTTSGANGGTGATTTITYNGTGGICSANGGTGGNSSTSSYWGAGVPGVAGGTGGTGFTYAGGNGAAGTSTSWPTSGGGGGGAGNGGAGNAGSSNTGGAGGPGGTPLYPGGSGGAGQAYETTGNGSAGTVPGGGGGGGNTGSNSCNSGSAYAGGAGANGQAVIIYSAVYGCPSATRVPVTVTATPSPVITASPASQSILTGQSISTITLTDNSATSMTWTRTTPSGTGGTVPTSGSGSGPLLINGTLTSTNTAPTTVTFTISTTYVGCVVTQTATVLVLGCAANFTSSTPWTCPTGVTSIQVECWGAGGGGGSSNTGGLFSSSGGGGGGGGGYSINPAVTVIPGNTYNIVVGTGGTAGSGGAGGAGGSSTFNSTTVVAKGGSGGGRGASGAAGAGATAGTGTTTYTGGAGAAGVSGTSSGGGGGGAGSTGNGNGASGITAGTAKANNGGAGGTGFTSGGHAGNTGSNYGGGGSGGCAAGLLGTEQNGGTGAGGLVAITITTGTPVFALGATSTRCQGAGAVTYTATATNTSGITYSLDATTAAYPGNSINSSTGAVTYAAGWSGTTVITAIASPTTACSGPISSTHTVTINPTSVGGTAASSQNICLGITPANITLISSTGTIQWQSSPNGVTYSNIPSATSTPLTSAQMGAITATTYYQAVVTSGVCPSATSVPVTVTVSTPATSGLSATDYVWSGNTGTEWNTASNWLYFNGGLSFSVPTLVPSQTNNVFIRAYGTSPTCATNTPIVSTAIAYCNNLTIETGKTFNMGGLQNLNVYGNWTNNGTFTSGTGTVLFIGSSAQTIGSTATPTLVSTTFNNLNINNNSGVSLGVNTAVGGSGILTLITGALNLNGNTLTINNSSPSALASDGGYILSNYYEPTFISDVAWVIGSGSGTNTYVFPFGYDASDYIPFTFLLNRGNIGTLTLSTYSATGGALADMPTNPNVTNLNLANSPGTDNSANVVKRFWLISPSGSGAADITFSFAPTGIENPINGLDPGGMIAQRWNTTTGAWDYPFISGQTNPTLYSVTVSGVTNFSPWAITGFDTPLPVELLSFNAKCDNVKVDLNWSTASETNNNYFSIDKSKDLGDWFNVGTVPGSGTTNTLHLYSTTDNSPFSGTSYYRLKQVDYNGASKTYNPVATECTDAELNSFGIISVYTNDSKNELTVVYNVPVDGNVNLYLIDDMGQRITGTTHTSTKGINTFVIPLNNSLIEGIYMIAIESTNNKVASKRIFIQ